MDYCLQLVHGKLSADVSGQKSKQFLKFRESNANNSRMRGLLEIVSVLRIETMEKCSQKLNKATPRVKIKRCKVGKESQKETAPIKIEPEFLPGNKIIMERVYSGHMSHKTAVNSPIVIVSSKKKSQGHPGKRSWTKMWSVVDSTTGRRKCNLCTFEYFTPSSFNNHYTSAHLQLKYKCPVPNCGKQFKSKTGFYFHNQSTHLCVRFRCVSCGKTFAQKPKLNKHIKEKSCVKNVNSTAKTAYQAVSPPTSPHEHTYPAAVDIKTGKPSCKVCNEAFKNYRALKGHYKSAHLKEKSKCEECNLEFPRRDNYLRHYRTAHAEKQDAKFSCHGCEKMFWRKDHLVQHEGLCHALTVTALLKTKRTVSCKNEVDQDQEQFSPELHSDIDIGEVKLERF